MKNIKMIMGLLLLALVLPAHASPSDADLDTYRTRLQVYVGMKQMPEQIAISLGNFFGRQGNFQTRNNIDGTVDVIYIEGDGSEIRFIANVARLSPVYVVVPQ